MSESNGVLPGADPNLISLQTNRRLRGSVVFGFSLVAVYGGLFLANGNGFILAAYFLAGVILVPIIVTVLGRIVPHQKKIVQMIALIVVGIGSFSTAWFSSHRPPAEIFRTCFGIEPPTGVTQMYGRVQWFDGQTYVLIFTSTDEAFAKILAAKPFKRSEQFDDEAHSAERFRLWWSVYIESLGAMADRRLNEPPAVTSPQMYELFDQDLSNLDYKNWSLVRDPASGKTWIVHRRG